MQNVTKVETPDPTVARLFFAEKSKVQPAGYDGLGINEDATVLLKGKISQIGSSEWEKGKGFTLTITSCEITTPKEAPVTMEAALAGANKTRKKV